MAGYLNHWQAPPLRSFEARERFRFDNCCGLADGDTRIGQQFILMIELPMDTTAVANAPRQSVPKASEHRMQLSDGTELFYRAWLPAQPTSKALVLFHRGHEHSGRLVDVVDELGLNDTA